MKALIIEDEEIREMHPVAGQAGHDVREQSLRDPLGQVVAGCSAIAACVEERRPEAVLRERFEETRARCEQAAAGERAEDAQRLLTNVKTALETWQRVWPRLGHDREFRLAVAREARLWAKRLSE